MQLESAVGDSEPQRSAVQIALRVFESHADCRVCGSLADVLQADAASQRAANSLVERRIAAIEDLDIRRTILFRDVSDRDGPVTYVPADNTKQDLPEFTDVPGIVAIDQVILNRFIQLLSFSPASCATGIIRAPQCEPFSASGALCPADEFSSARASTPGIFGHFQCSSQPHRWVPPFFMPFANCLASRAA